MIAIYKLIDPRTNAVRYIGRTKNPKARLAGHMRGHLHWVYDLRVAGGTPVMECIEWVEESKAPEREYFWIEEMKRLGCDLANKQRYVGLPTGRKSKSNTLKVPLDLHLRVKIHAFTNGFKLQDFVERVLEKSLNRKKP